MTMAQVSTRGGKAQVPARGGKPKYVVEYYTSADGKWRNFYGEAVFGQYGNAVEHMRQVSAPWDRVDFRVREL